MKFCKDDYDAATKVLRKHKQIWSAGLFKLSISVTVDFFNFHHFQTLPQSMFVEIIQFLAVSELTPLFQVCEEWRAICSGTEAWTAFYRQKFLLNNPGLLPRPNEDMQAAFHQRLQEPCIGDKVEVAWRGKFRLEFSDVYQGLAWWVAEIVDKHPALERYKIRYPGWESRWDEWVPRSRLRWKVAANTLVSINVGDHVELWCCGANVPGAWLETKVKRIRNGQYCLGKAITEGFLWVGRDRIRLKRRSQGAGAGAGAVQNAADSVGRGRGFVAMLQSMGGVFTNAPIAAASYVSTGARSAASSTTCNVM
jgi:hypothetical protein